MSDQLAMICFKLADRFNEPDVRKIANLPLPLIHCWMAYFDIKDSAEVST